MNTKKGNTQKIQTKGTKKCLQKEEKHLIMIKKENIVQTPEWHVLPQCCHSGVTGIELTITTMKRERE